MREGERGKKERERLREGDRGEGGRDRDRGGERGGGSWQFPQSSYPCCIRFYYQLNND